MDYPVDPDIAHMMRKESSMALSQQNREGINKKEALELRQEARALSYDVRVN